VAVASLNQQSKQKQLATTGAESAVAATSRHFSSTPATSRKTQLRWIAQSVQKIYQSDATTRSNLDTVTLHSNTTTSDSAWHNDSLRADVSVGSTEHAVQTNAVAATVVVHALSLLSVARTPLQVLEAGRLLQAVDIAQQPNAVQERVVKAAAITGLLQLALTIMHGMLSSSPAHLPSEICQDALCNALRRAGRIQRLEQLLCQMGAVVANQTTCADRRPKVSVVSFNTYLAALCDVALRKDPAAAQQQQGLDLVSIDRSLGGNSNSTAYKTMLPVEALDRAWSWIRDPAHTVRILSIAPDAVSYTTVLQAAAAFGNQTLVQDIWRELDANNIPNNIIAYNARLRCSAAISGASNGGGVGSKRERNQSLVPLETARMPHKKGDQEVLDIWDHEISANPLVRPDKYTIDLVLLPLIRAGRVGDVEALLDGFVKRNSEKVVSNAFAAFLITLVNGGELATARALFETYILPTLSPVMMGRAGGVMRMVRPIEQHFTVLLEGYRKQVQQGQYIRGTSESETVNQTTASIEEAWALYRMMFDSLGVRPNEYTITSMMGLCRTSTELSILLVEAATVLDIEFSSVVLRAACT
jgi:hypothetical protein